MNEIIDYVTLISVIVSVTGSYFYLKFKLSEVERVINEHKLTVKEEVIQIKASKSALRNELQQRCDERTADLKERHFELKTSIDKRLDSIDQKLDNLLLNFQNHNQK